MNGTATLSADGVYRYTLFRLINPAHLDKQVLWIMLNPSTATDEDGKDRTIPKCRKFCETWGFGAMTVVNAFAYRSPYPEALRIHPDPFGPENLRHLREQIEKHREHTIVAAWGANDISRSALGIVLRSYAVAGVRFKCLRKNADGSPGHPLYIPGKETLKEWTL